MNLFEVLTAARSYRFYSPITNPIIRSILFFIIELPLLTLYLHGPRLGGYGWYQGMAYSAICAEITNVPEEHWKENSATCIALIGRRFEGFLVAVYFIGYSLLLVSTIVAAAGWTITKVTFPRAIFPRAIFPKVTWPRRGSASASSSECGPESISATTAPTTQQFASSTARNL